MSVVLDSSALLALLLDEPGKDIVMEHAQGARLLSVNLTEILTRVFDRGGDPLAARLQISRLEVKTVAFDEQLAVSAAILREPTKSIGASLGDRACLSLALATGLPVLSADRKWAKLDVGVDIRMIR